MQWKPSPAMRRALWLSAVGPLLSLAALALRSFYVYHGEPNFYLDISNFAVVLLPFAFSIFFAFVPDMRNQHVVWKIAVITIGVGFSWLLWKQQHLAAEAVQRDEAQAIAKAVAQSNRHSDSKFDQVEADLDKNLGGRIDLLPGLLSQTETDLNASIGRVGSAPVKHSQLRFQVFDSDITSDEPRVSQSISPDSNEVYTVDFTVTNVSDTPTGSADIWVHLCGHCTFSEEPAGFDKPSGIDEDTRHKIIQLNPGVTFEKMTVKFKVAGGPFTYADVGFSYSCGACGKMAAEQTIRNFIFKPRLRH